MSQLEPGEQLDHYRIDAAVARSGMAVLYRGTNLENGQQVAIKIPHAEMQTDPILFERFKREEEIGQLLDHPGVVKTYNSEQRSSVYMVIEWANGGRTDIDQLTLLCPRCHANHVKQGWRCTMIDGIPWWTPPPWFDPERKPIRNTYFDQPIVHLSEPAPIE